MKIIDEKGRIFGKVNIIDLLVILLVIAVVALFAYRRLNKEDPIDTGTPAKLTYQVRVTGADPMTYDAIKNFVDASEGKSDQLFSSDSNNTLLDAYVVDCEATPYVSYVATDDGEVKRVESSGDDERLNLLFTIEAKVSDVLTNKVGTQQVRMGANHYLKTTHFEYYGTILNVEWETY